MTKAISLKIILESQSFHFSSTLISPMHTMNLIGLLANVNILIVYVETAKHISTFCRTIMQSLNSTMIYADTMQSLNSTMMYIPDSASIIMLVRVLLNFSKSMPETSFFCMKE